VATVDAAGRRRSKPIRDQVVEGLFGVEHDDQLATGLQHAGDLAFGQPDVKDVMQDAVAEDLVKGIVWIGNCQRTALIRCEV
jgi:hypothetical protein